MLACRGCSTGRSLKAVRAGIALATSVEEVPVGVAVNAGTAFVGNVGLRIGAGLHRPA
jgi:hypothetical protein